MKGRDSDFLCIYCGRFVSCDMRKTGKQYYTDSVWDRYDGIYYPEERVEFYHKKCKSKKEKKDEKETLELV